MAALALTAASVGLAATGSYMQYNASQAQSEAQRSVLAEQQKAEELRKRQMELEARRRQMEIVRNQQRARAQALAVSTNQGAAQSTGLQGAYGQSSGQANTQQLATSQNLQIGRGLFDINSTISGYNMQYAQAGTDIATGRGISSIGASLASITPQLNAMSKGFGGGGSSSSPSYGGWYDLSQTGGYPFPTPYR